MIAPKRKRITTHNAYARQLERIIMVERMNRSALAEIGSHVLGQEPGKQVADRGHPAPQIEQAIMAMALLLGYAGIGWLVLR